jgi:hypothetical protein
MGGHEPRDPESENVAYGPWAEWRSPDPGSHGPVGAEHHPAVASANPMDCEHAPGPSFVRTEGSQPASGLRDHATAPLLAEAYPSHFESHCDSLFFEGDPDPKPVPSPDGRPPANGHRSGGHGLVSALGGSSWSATAAAHRSDPAKFTRPPDSAARRLFTIALRRRPMARSGGFRKRRFTVATLGGGTLAIALTAAVLAGAIPTWLPLSTAGPRTPAHVSRQLAHGNDWRTELAPYLGASGSPLPVRERHALASEHELITIPASLLASR